MSKFNKSKKAMSSSTSYINASANIHHQHVGQENDGNQSLFTQEQVDCSRVVWLAMWALLEFIFDRPTCQNPPRTNPFVNIPRTPITARVMLYGIAALDGRELLADVSLLKYSVGDFVVTSSSQSTVDIIAIRRFCSKSPVERDRCVKFVLLRTDTTLMRRRCSNTQRAT